MSDVFASHQINRDERVHVEVNRLISLNSFGRDSWRDADFEYWPYAVDVYRWTDENDVIAFLSDDQHEMELKAEIVDWLQKRARDQWSCAYGLVVFACCEAAIVFRSVFGPEDAAPMTVRREPYGPECTLDGELVSWTGQACEGG